MELSFAHVSGMMKTSAGVAFTPDSPMYKILLQLNSVNVSQNVNEIAETIGATPEDVQAAIAQLYQAGVIYVEQENHYTLSRYGRVLAENVKTQPQTEAYNYDIPTTGTYNKVLALFKQRPYITKTELDSLKLTAPARKALNDLIQRNIIVDTGQGYSLSSVAQAHAKHNEEMLSLTDAQFEEAYQYFKQAHPEYKYVYKFMDTHADNKKVLFNDMRKYVKGAVIADSFSAQNVPTIEKWWGGKIIPPHTSIEDAFAKEIQYMAKNIKHVGEAAPTMDDVKTARNYVAILSSKTTPAIVAPILLQHPKGSVLPDSVMVDMAKSIVGKAFPSNLDVESVEDAIGQVIKKNRDISYGRFLTTDTVAEMTPVVAKFLREGAGGIEAFNLFITEANEAEGVVNAIFETNKDFHGLDLKKLALAAHVSGVDFSGCDFSNAQLENSVFDRCNFASVKFAGANLSGAKFIECNLDQANFENAAGLGSSDTEFDKNTGAPLNFYAVTGQKSDAEFKRATAEPQKAHLEVMMDAVEKDIAKVLADQLRSFVYKTAALRRMLSKLSFIATADRKQDLLNLLDPKLPIADWITKDALVQMVKDGELGRMGIDPKFNGKLIGRVSQQEKEREQARPKSVEETMSPAQKETSAFGQQLTAFLEANKGQHFVNRDALLKLIPETAVEVRGLVSSYGTAQQGEKKTQQYGLTPHDLEEISLQLSKAVHNVSNDSSAKVTAEKQKMHYFAYTSRISSIHHGSYGDRGNMNLDYPQTFGMILEPSTFGVTDPDVRKMIDALTVHGMWRKKDIHPASGHWQNAVATSRIQPHIVEQKDIGSTQKNMKKVWVMIELQSDPLQKNIYTLADTIDPEWKMPDIAGGLKLNSEPHKMLNVLAGMGGTEGVSPEALGAWGQKDSSTINYSLDEIATQWGIDEAVQKDFKSVVKMFLKSGTVPAAMLQVGQEAEGKKKYQRVPNGGMIVETLLAQHIIAPVLVRDDEAPMYVGADGKQFNKYQADSPKLLDVVKKAMTTVLTNAIKELRDAKLVSVDGATGNIKFTNYGQKTQNIYTKLGKFRQHYRDWPEMVILETINRALDLGIDEIWIPSASEYMKSKERDLSAYYDEPAKKFTNQLISPPFEISDRGSALWTGVTEDYHPTQYYVIKLSDWKTPMKTSSLRFTASRYTNFVRDYINTALTGYPYLEGVPQHMMIESAFAYMVEQGMVDAHDPQSLETVRTDINSEFNTSIEGKPVNFVLLFVTAKVNLEKQLLLIVRKTGEEPRKLALEMFMMILEKFPHIPANAKADFTMVFEALIDHYAGEFLGRAQQEYDEIKETGVNPNEGGGVEQPVSPTGEPLPPEEEGMSEVDRLIQKQQEEGAAAEKKQEEEGIRFEPPNAREQHNLVEAEINRLLDALHQATTDEEKNRIRKRLHEMSTLAALKFRLFTFSSQRVQEKRTGRKGTITETNPAGDVTVKWDDGTESKTTMFYLARLDAMEMPQGQAPSPMNNPRAREEMYRRDTYPPIQFSSIAKVAVIVHEDGKWKVKTHDKSRTLGEHATEAEAKKQLQAIEISKHKYSALQPPDEGTEVEFIKDYPWKMLGKPIVAGMKGIVRDFEGGKVNIELIKPFGFIRNFATWVIALQMGEWHEYIRPVTSKQAELTFAAIDQEFNRQKDINKGDPQRNDPFQYEPAHGEAAPVGGGNDGTGEKFDSSNRDMAMGQGSFYTDLTLPDLQRKEKELVQFEPSNHTNLQPSFIASFDFTRFKQVVLSGLRATSEFKGLSDEAITEKLYKDWLFAKEEGLL